MSSGLGTILSSVCYPLCNGLCDACKCACQGVTCCSGMGKERGNNSRISGREQLDAAKKQVSLQQQAEEEKKEDNKL